MNNNYNSQDLANHIANDVPDNIPFSNDSLDDFGIDPDTKADLAVENFFGATDVDNSAPPNHDDAAYLASIMESIPVTPVSEFLTNKLSELNSGRDKKSALTLDTGFYKNTQTGWFEEFNTSLDAENKNLSQKILCKPNGLFFKMSDSVQDALHACGVPNERLGELSKHFTLAYFGYTKSNSKSSDFESFKSAVLTLKDAKNPKSINALGEVESVRDSKIQEYLSKHDGIEVAAQKITDKSGKFITEHQSKNGVTPFVGVGDNLFLNRSALLHELESVPDLDKNYEVKALAGDDNIEKYCGFSEKLNSYYTDNLKIFELKTKDESKLPQAMLEELVTKHFTETKPELTKTPVAAFTKPLNKDGDQPLPENSNKKQDEPKENNDYQKYERDPRNPKTKNKDSDSTEDSEHKSLASAALDSASKGIGHLLTIALQLIKKLIALVMFVISAAVVLASRGLAKVTSNPDLAIDHWPFKKALTAPLTKGASNDLSNSPTNDAGNENQKAYDELKNADAESLKKAMDNDMVMSKKPTLDSELELAGFGPVSVADNVERASQNLRQEDKNIVAQEVLDGFKNLDDSELRELKDKIRLNTAHEISDDLDAKLAQKSLTHPVHGILLGQGDLVEKDGEKFGVVSAYDVGGELVYGVANDSPDGNYNIEYAHAQNLKLLDHGAVDFDNFNNLKTMVDEIARKDLSTREQSIENIDLLDHKAPTDAALSISDVLAQSPVVSLDSMGVDSKKISLGDLSMQDPHISKALAAEPHQMHKDESLKIEGIGTQNYHGLYGKLLDINDLVEAPLPNSGTTIRATVTGAYSSKEGLKYIVIDENGQYYTPEATNVTLISQCGGQLDANEAYAISKNKTAMPQSANSKEISLKTSQIPLNSAYEVAHTSLEITKSDNHYSVKKPSLGIGKYEFESHSDHISYIDKEGKTLHFASLGKSIDPNTGEQRAIVVNVKSPNEPKLSKDTKLSTINLDDPALKITASGITSASVLAAVAMAKDVFSVGAARRGAEIIAEYGNAARNMVLDKPSSMELALEHFKQNKLAETLLLSNAESYTPSNKITFGINANLTESSYDKSVVDNIIANPASLSLAENQAPGSAPQTILDIETPTQPTIEDISFNQALDLLFSDTKPVNPESTGQSLDIANSQDSHFSDVDLDNQISDANALHRIEPENIDQTRSNEARLTAINWAVNYRGGKLESDNDEDLTINNIRNRLDNMRMTLLNNSHSMLQGVAGAIERLSHDGEIPILSDSDVSNYEEMRGYILLNPYVKEKIFDSRDLINDYMVLQDDMQNRVLSQLEQSVKNIDFNSMGDEDREQFNKSIDTLRDQMRDDIKEIKLLDSFVETLEVVRDVRGREDLEGDVGRLFAREESPDRLINTQMDAVTTRINNIQQRSEQLIENTQSQSNNNEIRNEM